MSTLSQIILCTPGTVTRLQPGQSIVHIVAETKTEVQGCTRCLRILSDVGFAKWPVGKRLKETQHGGMLEWTIE